jgi:hypothetical protein
VIHVHHGLHTPQIELHLPNIMPPKIEAFTR